jgi:predicted membrane metal-binding protein
MSLLFEERSIVPFLIITLVLGGGAAWMSGRAVALSWKPAWKAALWMIPLGFAVRFIHFALGAGTLLSPYYLAVDTLVLVAIALVSYRAARTHQMVRQYPWIYQRTGPFAWRRLVSGDGIAVPGEQNPATPAR